MKIETVNLSEIYNVKGGTLTAYIADKPLDSKSAGWKRPAVIIVPGGAYAFCSKREQEVIAFEFLSRGFNAFVLQYLCAGSGVHYPEQLSELAVATDCIKKNAEAYSINPKEIFAVGFSAGGHLVGCLSTDFRIAQSEYGEALDCKLTAAGLIYPVISDKYGHTTSHTYLFEYAPNKEKLCKTRLDELVCDVTVPTYIYSTAQDKTVPPINSLRYALALSQSSIPYELHIYKNGGHGMSNCSAEINSDTKNIARNKAWLNDCAVFFREYTEEVF